MKQIEINYLTSTGYESLYPNVNCASITDFAENLYSKSEVDEMVQELRNQTGDLKFAMGQYTGTELVSDLNPGTNEVVAGSWAVITVGFKPEKIILFTNGGAGNSFSSADYTGGNFYSLPFYVTPYGLPSVNLIEARTNGFAARNGVNRTTSRVSYYFNQKDYIIYYFAFG